MNLKNPITKADHFLGSLEAPVVLVEYGDFECSHCAEAFPTLEQLVEKCKDELCFVYRHFPLVTMHPHAELAAVSAEAAGRQNKFWEMHHHLFLNSGRLSEEKILTLTETVKLDFEQFQQDLSDETILDKIRNDVHAGARSGVNGTPTLFFNGLRYDGSRTYQALRMMVDSLATGVEIRPYQF